MRHEIAALVQRGLRAFGDVAEDITFTQHLSVAYDVTSGTPTPAARPVLTSAVFTDYRQDEIDGVRVLATDQRALIAALDLPGIVPVPQDRLTRADGEEWTVMGPVGVDPAKSLWTLQLRRP